MSELSQLPVDYYDKYLTVHAKSRHPSAIRSLFPLENVSRPLFIIHSFIHSFMYVFRNQI